MDAVVAALDGLGYKRVMFRSDNENSLLAFLRGVRLRWTGEVVPTHSPEGEPQSNGAAEVGVQLLKGHVRTVLDQLRVASGSELGDSHPIIAWSVGYATAMHRRFKVGEDGKTAYERCYGRRAPVPLAAFGERVFYAPLMPGGRKLAPLASRMLEGRYLGPADGSSCVLVGTPTGTIRARTIKQRCPSERWTGDLQEDIAGTPMRPDATDSRHRNPGIRAPVAMAHEGPVPEVPRPEKPTHKRVYLFRKDFEKYGFTDLCPGCASIRRGDRLLDRHTDACRTRMEGHLATNREGAERLQRASERLDRWLVAEVERGGEPPPPGAPTVGGAPAGPANAAATSAPPEPPVQPERNPSSDQDTAAPADAPDGPNSTWLPQSSRLPQQSSSSVAPAAADSNPVTPRTGDQPLWSGERPAPEDQQSKRFASSRPGAGPDDGLAASIRRHLAAEAPAASAAAAIAPAAEEETQQRDQVDMDQANLEYAGTDTFADILALGATSEERGGFLEVYSPPRVAPLAPIKAGLPYEGSLDLRTGWDFDEPRHRAAAMDLVRKRKPLWVIGSPMCTWFSQLEALAHRHMNQEEREQGMQHAIDHLTFMFSIYEEQIKHDRYFIHEHPHHAASWSTPVVLDFLLRHGQERDLYQVISHGCRFEMKSVDDNGDKGYILKPTRWLTNSACVAEILDKQCRGGMNTSSFSAEPRASGRGRAMPSSTRRSFARLSCAAWRSRCAWTPSASAGSTYQKLLPLTSLSSCGRTRRT